MLLMNALLYRYQGKCALYHLILPFCLKLLGRAIGTSQHTTIPYSSSFVVVAERQCEQSCQVCVSICFPNGVDGRFWILLPQQA